LIEIKVPVEPEVAKEGVAVVELIALAIEDVQAVEVVGHVVEQDKVVEQEELTINEAMV
jgi:hypothetical protein